MLILFGTITLFISCGVSDYERSQCALDVDDTLRAFATDYEYKLMNAVDSNGNTQSVEACYIRRGYTEDYIEDLGRRKGFMNSNGECTGDEKAELNAQINSKIEELQQALVDVYVCE